MTQLILRLRIVPMTMGPGDQVTCPHLGKWATAVQCRGAGAGEPGAVMGCSAPGCWPGAATAVIML